MRRKWIVAGAASLAAVAGAAMMATSVFGGGAEPRADVAVVDVKMQAAESPSSQRAKKAKKPTVIYLTGEPSTVDSAQLGPNMDIRAVQLPAERARDRGRDRGQRSSTSTCRAATSARTGASTTS